MELLNLSDLKPTSFQENEDDHNITDNFGIDFSTFIKILEKGDL